MIKQTIINSLYFKMLLRVEGYKRQQGIHSATRNYVSLNVHPVLTKLLNDVAVEIFAGGGCFEVGGLTSIETKIKTFAEKEVVRHWNEIPSKEVGPFFNYLISDAVV